MKKILILITFLAFVITSYTFSNSNTYTKTAKSFKDSNKCSSTLICNVTNQDRSFGEVYGPIIIGLLAIIASIWIGIYSVNKQLETTRRETISNFRIHWLEDFRILTVELQTALDNIAFKYDGKVKVGINHFGEDIDYIKVRASLHKMRFMFNLNKKENEDYYKFIEIYIDAFLAFYQNSPDKLRFEDIQELRETYYERTQIILNEVWVKAKNLS